MNSKTWNYSLFSELSNMPFYFKLGVSTWWHIWKPMESTTSVDRHCAFPSQTLSIVYAFQQFCGYVEARGGIKKKVAMWQNSWMNTNVAEQRICSSSEICRSISLGILYSNVPSIKKIFSHNNNMGHNI